MNTKISLTNTFVNRINIALTSKSISSDLLSRSKLLADICKVSPQAARKWLSGKSLPDYENMMLIASWFLTTTSYLIGETDNTDITSAENSILDNGAIRGVISVKIDENFFSGELKAGDTVLCHPCKTIENNGDIYLLQSGSLRFFRRLSLTENSDLIIEYQNNDEKIINIQTDKDMINLFLSSLVGKVDAVLRRVTINAENSTK